MDVFVTDSAHHRGVLPHDQGKILKKEVVSVTRKVMVEHLQPNNFVSSLIYFLILYVYALTFTLLELKVISLCHQYRARPACKSVQSEQALS